MSYWSRKFTSLQHLIAKHPGGPDHDQEDHGNWARGGGGGEKPEGEMARGPGFNRDIRGKTSSYYTRRHYEGVKDVLREHRRTGDEGVSERVINDLAGLFSKDNPHFRGDIFTRAARGEAYRYRSRAPRGGSVYSQRAYRDVAGALSRARSASYPGSRGRAEIDNSIKELEDKFVSAFSRDNPKFKEDLFRRAALGKSVAWDDDDDLSIVKHPGGSDHDQKDHGNWADGSMRSIRDTGPDPDDKPGVDPDGSPNDDEWREAGRAMSKLLASKEHREVIDSAIRRAVDNPQFKIDDEERRLWVLNDEGLYNYARSSGFKV